MKVLNIIKSIELRRNNIMVRGIAKLQTLSLE